MKATDLRKSILQAAVQGKLVPQNKNDEPAFGLLKRIQAEKATLIKAGKLKKEKPLPPIMEDEVPYDLPESWVWCRLGNIILDDVGGGTPSKQHAEYWNGDIPWASVKDLNCSVLTETKDHITKLGLQNSTSNLIKPGTVIVCMRMGLGKITITQIPVAINQDLRALTLPEGMVLTNYFIDWFKTLIILGGGMTVKGITVSELFNMCFPLPPLAEQQRIVAKVDELMALCDELEADEKEQDALEEHLVEDLPKAILQSAVQGKLVPQNKNDEPASELLKRIQAEKATLIKAGKLKKEKPLPPIMEDEILYDLPESWVWCRLGNMILDDVGGGTPSKQHAEYWNGDIPWASVKDLNCSVLTETKDHITKLGLQNSTSNLIKPGTVIVCMRMGLGKITITQIPVAINQDLRALTLPEGMVLTNYFIDWFKTLIILGGGMTVKGITVSELFNMCFPLPPLAEQRRIVSKVDELMKLCEELKHVESKPIDYSNVISFHATEATAEPVAMAARGDANNLSAGAKQAIEDLFAEDE